MSSFSPFDAVGQKFQMRMGNTIFNCVIKEAMFSVQPHWNTILDDLGDISEEIPAYTEYGMNIDIVMWPAERIPEELTDGAHELEVHRSAGDLRPPVRQLQQRGRPELVAPPEDEAGGEDAV